MNPFVATRGVSWSSSAIFDVTNCDDGLVGKLSVEFPGRANSSTEGSTSNGLSLRRMAEPARLSLPVRNPAPNADRCVGSVAVLRVTGLGEWPKGN